VTPPRPPHLPHAPTPILRRHVDIKMPPLSAFELVGKISTLVLPHLFCNISFDLFRSENPSMNWYFKCHQPSLLHSAQNLFLPQLYACFGRLNPKKIAKLHSIPQRTQFLCQFSVSLHSAFAFGRVYVS
jgi:hypothetical protein